MNSIVKILCSLAIASAVALPTLADTICQRKNQDPPAHYLTRVQALKFISGNTCPRGYRKVGIVATTADIEAVSEKVFQAKASSLGAVGASGPTGAQGPQGIQGPAGAPGGDGARGGLPPVSISLNTSTGFACQKISLADYCDDRDGCVVRLLITDKLADVIAPYEAVIAMENSVAQSYAQPGISFTLLDHARTNGATGSPWISTYLNTATQYTLWAPISNAVAFTNYIHANCPGQSGLNSAAFSGTDARSINVMTSSRYAIDMTLFDN